MRMLTPVKGIPTSPHLENSGLNGVNAKVPLRIKSYTDKNYTLVWYIRVDLGPQKQLD